MKSAMELLLELDEFTPVDIEDNEDFSNIYIKLKGKRLCKITNYVFDRQDGVYTVMLSNKIYFKQTYEEHLDREIPRNEQRWEEVGLIEFVGKKIDYVSMTPTYKKKYEDLKEIFDILKKYIVVHRYKGAQTLANFCKNNVDLCDMTIDNFDNAAHPKEFDLVASYFDPEYADYVEKCKKGGK